MEAFIIGYMIANEVVGVVMAADYINHLKKNGYFMQRKIAKWRSKKPFTDREFWDAFNYFENALKEAKKQGKTELHITALSTLEKAYYILKYYINLDTLDAPLYVIEHLYSPAYQEMIDSYGIKIIPVH